MELAVVNPWGKSCQPNANRSSPVRTLHQPIPSPRTFDGPATLPPAVATLEAEAIPSADPFVFAGLADDSAAPGGWDRAWITSHYNGKIDQPRWFQHPLSDGGTPQCSPDLLAAWDFSLDIATQRLTDTGPFSLHGKTVNLPSRAITGAAWDGSEHHWRHAPGQYGAIHFHEDDLHDCTWESDFEYTVPQDLPSGVYAARLRMENDEYRIPFFVRAARNSPRSDIVFIASTATYLAYANSRQAAELIYGATGDESFLDEVYRVRRQNIWRRSRRRLAECGPRLGG